jgi:hypothetical protein
MTLSTSTASSVEKLPVNDTRKDIVDFEAKIGDLDESFQGDSILCPLKHTFSDGIYVREIFIPAGTYLVGKIHKHEHPNFLLSGTVEVVTEAGRESLTGPLSIMSPAGTKRALYAVTDLVWVTVHHNPTNTQNVSVLEKDIIAESYEAYDEFVLHGGKVGIIDKFLNFFKR